MTSTMIHPPNITQQVQKLTPMLAQIHAQTTTVMEWPSISSMDKLRTEDAPGTFRKKSVNHKMDSVTHNALKQFGTDNYKELSSRGLRIQKVALTVKNTLKEPMWLSLHLQTISDSHLLVLMKMLYLRLTTLNCQRTCLNVQWQLTMYSLTSNTSSASTFHTTWVHSTTPTRSTWEPLECLPHQTIHFGFTVMKSKTNLTTSLSHTTERSMN